MARLAMALAKVGCHVEAVCPADHPIVNTSALRRLYRYRGLSPLASFRRAIVSAKPDFIAPGDDLATQHLQDLYLQESRRGNKQKAICAVIERSLGSPEGFSVVYDRAAFIGVAAEQGARVPATERLSGLADLRRWIAKIGFPTVLKANGTSGGDGVRVVYTPEQAEHAFRKLQSPPLLARAMKRALVDRDQTLIWRSILRRRSVVNAQAFVEGREATSAVLCWGGSVLASLHFEVLRKMHAAGHATVLRLIEHPEMTLAVEKIVRRLNLSGLQGFDFMLEAQTGNAYLIEINPRNTQVGHLRLGPGRDFPAALHAVLSGYSSCQSEKVTDKDTVALFPQEWIRDPASEFLRSAYHDLPWEEPALLNDCVRRARTQRAKYLKQSLSTVSSPSFAIDR